MTQIKFTDLSVLGAVNSQLENLVKYTALIALWFELRTHLIYTMTILHTDYFYTLDHLYRMTILHNDHLHNDHLLLLRILKS